MSLATRCVHCGTIFRVVQDQLKVSEGWVRCGRCQQVFNAMENLFDLEREAPPPFTGNARPAPDATQPMQRPAETTVAMPRPSAAPREQAPVSAPAPLVAAGTAEEPAIETTSLLRSASREPALDLRASPEPKRDEGPESSGFADARFNLDLLDDDDHGAPRSVAAKAIAAVHAQKPEPPPAPLFVQQAEREARWQHPAVKATLVFTALLLMLLLAMQAAVQFRSLLVAQWPAARALVLPLCNGCEIAPPRRIDSLSVDATGLQRTDSPGVYRFSTVLHNKASMVVRVPDVELSLTDADGRLISRRALTPEELGVRQPAIGAGSDLTLQARIATGEQRVVGYTVEIFYP
jgi:predicted Zn finger-like uncharacterized protein